MSIHRRLKKVEQIVKKKKRRGHQYAWELLRIGMKPGLSEHWQQRSKKGLALFMELEEACLRSDLA